MTPLETRRLGHGDVRVTTLGFGAAPIGNFKRAVTDEEARTVVDAAWDAGIRLFDTAPLYGFGLSELRLGEALRNRPREEFTVVTKVGRTLRPAAFDRPRAIDPADANWIEPAAFVPEFDYSYDGVMRSFEDSLQRLALGRVDVLLMHDLDVTTHGRAGFDVYFEQAMDGAWRALEQLRSEGLVGAIGLGVNDIEPCEEALRRHDFDAFLLAGRYTLLEQGALETFFPLCEERGASVVVGGGYNSGILATGAVPGARYNYGPAPAWAMDRTRRIEKVCATFDVPLKAAALQFVLAHPVVAAHAPGTRSLAQLVENAELTAFPIPSDLWTELKAHSLLGPDVPVPG